MTTEIFEPVTWLTRKEAAAHIGYSVGSLANWAGKLVFGIFAALAEHEREQISERTLAGLASARARGRKGGRPLIMTSAKVRLAKASMGRRDTKVGDLCKELGITRQTLYGTSHPRVSYEPDGKRLVTRNQIR